MATQIVMDQSGDTRHHFDAKDVKALSDAERRFKALTGAGFYGCGSECTAKCRSSDLSIPMQRKLSSFPDWSAAD